MFSGIQSKIILLLVTAVFLMAVIGTTNIITDRSKREVSRVAMGCQKVALCVKEGMMLEDRFFKQADKETLNRIQENRETMGRLIEEAKRHAGHPDIDELIYRIVTNSADRQALFDQVKVNLETIGTLMERYDVTMKTIGENCMHMVGAINEEEAFLSMEGRTLSANFTSLRDQLIFLQSMADKKTINLQHLYVKYAFDRFQKEKEILDKKIQAELPGMNNLVNLIDNEKISSYWTNIESLVGTGGNLEMEILGALKKNKAFTQTLKSNADEIQEHISHIVSLAEEDIDITTRRGNIAGISTFIVGIVLLGGIGTLTIRSVLNTLRRVVLSLKDIAEGDGDLTQRLSVTSKDALGELCDYFNVFVEKLQMIIREIAGNSDPLKEASTHLLSLSKTLSDNTDLTFARASQVAASSEEMSIGVASMAAAIDQTSNNIKQVSGAAENMAVTINDVTEKTVEASDITCNAVIEAEKVSTMITELGQAADEIGNVTESISEISDQTNLLALNATIEAARAGEFGKGFAVVANEIKGLANQTTEATYEIRRRIEKIQQSSTQTVSQIVRITAIINNVNEIVSDISFSLNEQLGVIKDIAGNMVQAAEGIGEINQNIGQFSTTAREIASDISEVDHASGDTAKNGASLSANAEHLLEMADNLSRLVGRFSV